MVSHRNRLSLTCGGNLLADCADHGRAAEAEPDEPERDHNGRAAGLSLAVSADAEGRGGSHRQHQQHQRLLGLGRAAHSAYRLFGGEICGQGLHRGADYRLRINAPHIRCSVVMPGQIGISIRANTRKIHSGDREADAIDAAALAQGRERFALLGRDVSQLSDDQLRNLRAELERRFRDEALTSAAQAATIILDGVKAERWRILVGADAHKIDELVRRSPERAHDIAFFDEFAGAAGWTERLSLENPDLLPPG